MNGLTEEQKVAARAAFIKGMKEFVGLLSTKPWFMEGFKPNVSQEHKTLVMIHYALYKLITQADNSIPTIIAELVIRQKMLDICEDFGIQKATTEVFFETNLDEFFDGRVNEAKCEECSSKNDCETYQQRKTAE